MSSRTVELRSCMVKINHVSDDLLDVVWDIQEGNGNRVMRPELFQELVKILRYVSKDLHDIIDDMQEEENGKLN